MNVTPDSIENNKDQAQVTSEYVPYVPYVAPASDAPVKEIVALSFSDPFRWLGSGWRDMMAAKGIAGIGTAQIRAINGL